MQNNLKVYGKEGTPCPRCGTEIVKIKVGGRGTHFCPKCQVVK
ncbi:zinc finger domain-containing protein [Companilactobacillus paralimentarius]|nr:zinc finger domain-containing protein [Companilactobacillus paralimentarius]